MTVTPGVTRDVTGPSRPARLDARGRRLWAQMTDGVQLSPAELVLVEEACRLADRLERLDSMLAGEAAEWLEFRQNEETGVVIVYVDKVLGEARLQATALKQLVGELRQLRAAATGPVVPAPAPRPAAAPAADGVGGGGGSGITSLTARIAAKRGNAPAG